MFEDKEYVTIKELADVLKMDRSGCLKYVKKMKINRFDVRPLEARGQTMSAITPEDAQLIIERREEEGYINGDVVGGNSNNADNGVFT